MMRYYPQGKQYKSVNATSTIIDYDSKNSIMKYFFPDFSGVYHYEGPSTVKEIFAG